MKEKIYKVFTAFSGYDSQMMALTRLLKEFPYIIFRLVGWAETDSAAIESHNAVFPQYADLNYGDISEIDWSEVEDFDLFTYSFPCTDVSNSGNSRGIEKGSGTSSSLLWECERAIAEKRPMFCVMENVKALIGKRNMAGTKVSMSDEFMKWEFAMSRLGYKNYLKVIDAADYGVPQHRERTIMVSIRRDDADPMYLFPESISLAKDAVKSLFETSASEDNYLPDVETNRIIATLVSSLDESSSDSYKMPIVTSDACHHSHLVSQSLTQTTKNGCLHTIMASSTHPKQSLINFFKTGSHAITGVIEVWQSDRRLNFKKVNHVELSEKLTTNINQGRLGNCRKTILDTVKGLEDNQYIRLRCLTAKECHRFMGNSDEDFAKMQSCGVKDHQLRKQAGNSIVVDVLFYVFKSLFLFVKEY